MNNNQKLGDFNPQGLTDQQVVENREKYGKNLLTPPHKISMWKLYLDKYKDPIIEVLLVAAAISLALGFLENDFVEAIGILLAVFFATTVGFYFERDAAHKFDLLTALGEEQPVKVRRHGKVMEIPRLDVVVGDVILVETGDEIPADGRLFFSRNLQINESQLTGEPVTTKSAEPEEEADAKNAAAFPKNVILRSSMVMSGRGEAVVTAVGDATEIGKVSELTTAETSVKTPLNIQLSKLAALISKIGSLVAVAAFVLFLVHDILTNPAWGSKDYFYLAQIVLKYFMMAVTLIVMAVPEGLPMAVTLALALNMRRMLKSNNLVRRLHACETMGAVTVICTDKTGTLTENKMTVGRMCLCHPEPFKTGVSPGEQAEKDFLAQAIAVNSTAELDGDKGIGNPTEVALLHWMRREGYDYETLRTNLVIEDQMPFSTEKKYMVTIAAVNGQRYLFIKGAPEKILALCDLTDDNRKNAQDELLDFQNHAMRTLAFAYKRIPEGRSKPEEEEIIKSDHLLTHLSLQALTAISDPVRKEVPEAVRKCQKAGITVKIVTGDTSATAVEIGRQIHLFDDVKPGTDLSPYTITGAEWEALSDEEASKRARTLRVMSRARPADKQRLVELLQKGKEVVAVTGDGTNDAPALHYAHVGLSLGSGTSVAKAASDITLMDDSFGSITSAVMWGRSIYKNIQRFLFFQLTVNVTALLLVLVGSVVSTQLPLTVTQILWVNLIMDTFAAMALASLPPSPEVLKEKPRNPDSFIITRPIGIAIFSCGFFFFLIMFLFLLWCVRRGPEGGVSVHELTWFFTAFVMLQFWNLFNAKALGSHHSAFHHFFADKGMFWVLLIILVGQWLIVTFGGNMFRTEPLSFKEWMIIIGATSMVLWGGEAGRAVERLAARHKE
ncbi:MAG: calcium-translocating P-type ATPase, PMCA-type [Prevotella sp.]|jgi:Ca2+-transporting ATPase|nr:calcium-translocating P-type ATPase, PMCA-type [Prevotella sp.]MCH4018993.1 calcium-translocating P-type ATPase, PMCA-type [Prevotella sp.]MCH4099414.1 calcium-translocating P-type ATPase, PMCA-type [Prevotella sp.]MCI1324277.1 calcium-translocating P-type ATPase, PMCA-type [Prevotella sp.]MCI1349317.1 calcium-translocating P-type ATPase, PMCA-type [Prevotella sp.]MCI1415926.1 calcium-translocating P-type ATPase, PMCA-type [Prevotella sp.]